MLMKLRFWFESAHTFDFWVSNVQPVVASLFGNGHKGTKARDDAQMGILEMHEWILMHVIDEANNAFWPILAPTLEDIKFF